MSNRLLGLSVLKDELSKKKNTLDRTKSSNASASSSSCLQALIKESKRSSSYKSGIFGDKVSSASSESSIRKKEAKKLKDQARYEEDLELIRSREALIRKSRLYDEKIKSLAQNLREGEDSDEELLQDGDESVHNTKEQLVDFQRKAIHMVLKPSEYSLPEQDLDPDIDLGRRLREDEDLGSSDEAEHYGGAWTEYVDSLGRTRRCLKSEVKTLKRLDDELLDDDGGRSLPAVTSSAATNYVKSVNQPRSSNIVYGYQKVHAKYRDLLADEVRDHGVGYYKLSTDEASRKRQLKTFSDMREERIDYKRLKRQSSSPEPQLRGGRGKSSLNSSQPKISSSKPYAARMPSNLEDIPLPD